MRRSSSVGAWERAPLECFQRSFPRLNSGWGTVKSSGRQSRGPGVNTKEWEDAVIGGIPCLCFDKGLNGRGSLMDCAGGRSPKGHGRAARLPLSTTPTTASKPT